MKNNKAFTLIELLVVVLIIGILSAVALPQYQKVVEKARMAEALQNIKTMQDNIELYLLENGGFPANQIDYADLASTTELKGGTFQNRSYETKHFSYWSQCNHSYCDIQVDRLLSNNYSFYLQKDSSGWNFQDCITQMNDFGRSICKSLQGQGWNYRDGEI